ncbi:MAG: Crp/Fnr family transcriptional regulator [Actinomycetota bacterium]
MARHLPREPLPLTTALPAGTALVRQGDACRRAWIVQTGVLIERVVSPEGRVLIPRLPGPGDLLGGVDGAPAAGTVRALRRSTVRIAGSDELVAALAERERAILAFAGAVAWLDTRTKIERRLREIALRFGRPVPGGIAVGLTLTQEDLGAFAGTTRESANRAVAELLRCGAIQRLSRGRYLVRTALRSVDA